MNDKWIRRTLDSVLGKKKASKIVKKVFVKKRKKMWASMTVEERKRKMEPVREAEWGNLTKEQRRNHPWVKAGQIASLQSIKKGSKNQRCAFELLVQKLNKFNWKYNFIVDNGWQIDMASHRNNIFIEWDGRPHRKPMFGIKQLRNVQNRDKQKNKIITQKLNGTLIRIKDDGRFNPQFVEERINKIIEFIKNNELKNEVYHF